MSTSIDLSLLEKAIKAGEGEAFLKSIQDSRVIQEALEFSMIEKRQDCIEMLLPYSTQDQSSLLAFSASRDDLNNVKRLLPYCDINQDTRALFMAARYGNMRCVQFLAKYISVDGWGTYEWQYATTACHDWLKECGKAVYEKELLSNSADFSINPIKKSRL